MHSFYPKDWIKYHLDLNSFYERTLVVLSHWKYTKKSACVRVCLYTQSLDKRLSWVWKSRFKIIFPQNLRLHWMAFLYPASSRTVWLSFSHKGYGRCNRFSLSLRDLKYSLPVVFRNLTKMHLWWVFFSSYNPISTNYIFYQKKKIMCSFIKL